ncbi:unnamed protein product [Cuscuta epithymum]|uniref:Uncharacterized protein n=1 Tax=Cuscuta epithymum TaxID=186058 RepID=A0AAV0CX57_9ASTE|nr:unnamed protein product [Cuscuta epithymum]
MDASAFDFLARVALIACTLFINPILHIGVRDEILLLGQRLLHLFRRIILIRGRP